MILQVKTDEIGSHYPAVEFKPTLLSGYTDVSNNIIAVARYGIIRIGFKRTRDLLKVLIPTKLQSGQTLTPAEMSVGVNFIVLPYQMRLAVVSDEQDANNWRQMVILTEGSDADNLEGRRRIYEELRITVSHFLRKELLTVSDLEDFYNDIKDLSDTYIATNSPALEVFLRGVNFTGSSKYNNLVGEFERKTYFSVELRTALNEVLNGSY